MIFSMIAKTDSVLFEHLASSSVFRGDSKTIQNDLIHIVAEVINYELTLLLNS